MCPFAGPLWNLYQALLILLLMMEGERPDTQGCAVNESLWKSLRAGCGGHAWILLSAGKLRYEGSLNCEATQGYLLGSRPAWTAAETLSKKNLGITCDVVARY